MKSAYDAKVDALYIRWTDTKIAESDEISEGVILDYDLEGNVIGIEVLNASRKIKGLLNKHELIEIGK
ncbi:MAG: DUF2283 domain-containing protein [Coleofasciculaceae cyanobacterium SM2_1_6]|nr:DUF2283 domain-containing protein [Coleofasciculaceae cyanobacterium SM2_1_6]